MARPRGRKNVRYLFLCHGAPHVTIFRRPGVKRDKPLAIFDALITELGSKFGLGAKSSALIAEVIRFMTSEPGGTGGFVDRLKNAGPASLVSSAGQ